MEDDTVGEVTQKGLIGSPWTPGGEEEEQRNVLLVKLCQCRQALLAGLLAEPTPEAPGISGK